jgi:mono/diheme cytochrome c family protein
MVDKLVAGGVARPTFDGRELADIIAYIGAAARDGGGAAERVVPGVPERGQRLFTTKRCIVCHSVGGTGAKGGKVGPELGRRQHVSLTQFAALMWNHAPTMWARMEQRGIQVPRLQGQEMADLVAYLYVSHYFEGPGSPEQGRAVLESKGCLNCHAARGRGGKVGADLASYRAARSSAALVASLWNHPRYLMARRQEVPWPLLGGEELANVSAYLATLPGAAAPKPKP